MYASLDVSIVMMMFFELSIFYSEKYLSFQAGLEPTTFRSSARRSKLEEQIIIAKNSSKNIIITIFTAELA